MASAPSPITGRGLRRGLVTHIARNSTYIVEPRLSVVYDGVAFQMRRPLNAGGQVVRSRSKLVQQLLHNGQLPLQQLFLSFACHTQWHSQAHPCHTQGLSQTHACDAPLYLQESEAQSRDRGALHARVRCPTCCAMSIRPKVASSAAEAGACRIMSSVINGLVVS